MKPYLIILSVLLLLLTSACWDSRQLRDLTVVKSAGLDLIEDGKVRVTLSSPIPEKYRTQERATVITSEGDTIRNAREHIESRKSEMVDTSKLRALLIGEELAKQDIYPPLDVFYRDPRAPLAAKVAITRNSAKTLVELRPDDRPRTSELIADLFHAAEKQTMIPITNLQLICPLIFDRGIDAVLPLVSMESGAVKLDGVALFNDKVFSGDLTIPDSTILLLMQDQLKRSASITSKVHDDDKIKMEDYVTVDVKDINRSLEIVIDKDTKKITVPLKLKMEVNVIEYPHDDLNTEEKIKKLNKKLSENMTKKVKEVADLIQEYNCDALGIGRRIFAFDNAFWDEIEWKEVYQDVEIKPEVEVEIVRHGILY